MSIRARSRPHSDRLWCAGGVWMALLASAVCVSRSDAVVLASDVIGSAAGPASSASLRIGFTAGQTVCGTATSSGCKEIAGFWGKFFPDVSSAEDVVVSLETRLHGAWPNPTIHDTVIRFDLAIPQAAAAVPVRLDLFDVSGRCVRVLLEGELPPGAHHVAWDRRSELGSKVGSGVYFARFRAGSYQETARIVVR